jgi:translation initiation factor IF-1
MTPAARSCSTPPCDKCVPAHHRHGRGCGVRVVSIWFHWDGTALVMARLPGAPKLKALHTGDRVAITIDTNDPPHHVLAIRGTAEVTQTEGVVREYAQAAVRYLGKEQGEAYVGSLPRDIRMGRIAVRPDHVVVLDFETRFPDRGVVVRIGVAVRLAS